MPGVSQPWIPVLRQDRSGFQGAGTDLNQMPDLKAAEIKGEESSPWLN